VSDPERPGSRRRSPFTALPPQVDLPALEREILQRWEADKVFARSLEASAGRPQ
jgi:isoleucyl-tRNA synthetase